MRPDFDKPSLLQRVAPAFVGFDVWLLLALLILAAFGLLTMYSAGFDHGSRFVDHGRNMMLAAVILFLVAQVPPQRLMALAVPLYVAGVALLLATALFGVTKKGATRWLDLGVVVQPSELLKIATPLMLAWWFQRREGHLRVLDFVVALGLLAIPVGLIVKQPDLGTAILVLASGLFVIFFDWNVSLLAGWFTLAFMVLPVVITASEESLKAVPQGFREGSLALGATKWQTIRTNVLPYAMPGILTSSILGIARVAGETAPIMFTAAYAMRDKLPWEDLAKSSDFVFQGVMALPYHIYVVSSKIPQNEYTERVQYGTAFVFLMIVALIATTSILLRNHLRNRYRW
jgi:ABC-type phosphate transport system permease subunit